MPLQPPSSVPTQQPLTGPGLSRTRSLRRPQAGPSASTATAATTTTTTAATGSVTGKRVAPLIPSVRAKATTTIAAGAGILHRNASPSRLPTKQAALSSTGTTSTTAGGRPRPPSATGSSGLASTRSRRSDGTAVPPKAQSSATGASTTARPFTKPPSSSRSHLISSGATSTNGAARPTSSGGLPSSHTSTASATTSSSTPFGQLSRTRSTTANAASGPPPRGRTRTQSASTPLSTTTAAAAAARLPSKPPGRQPSRPPSATTLSSATTLRPPSAQSTSTGSSSPASRPPTRSTSHSTSTTVSVTAAKKAPPITSHRRQYSGGAGTGAAAAAAAAQRDRPAFSTLQQHFSPAKNTAPKPRIAAILAPPASPSKKPANMVLSAETSRLQTALLQLHLLHRNAAAVSAEWHASARNALVGERFSALVAENAQLLQMASERAESANAAALQAWAEDGSDNVPLEERIQALDAVLAGVWSLAGQDVAAAAGQDMNKSKNKGSAVTSRYTLVVRRFERWAQQTAELVAARRGIDSLEALLETMQSEETYRRSDGRSTVAAGAGFLSNESEPLLDAAWHEECSNLTHRLEGWQQQLARLGRGILGDLEANTPTNGKKEETGRQRQSSLHRILSGCSGLVDGMLEELQMMLQLEQDAAEQELAWIQKMNASVGMDTDLPSQIARPAARVGSIWRSI
ncbi:hypothetical protein SEPCBS57363_001009 [Sporothrix epigloea]|uniref:Karyogamy protein n=1 Tax=Sporothrix epigloea TaxID=1892477 RepID=A0ABP0D9E3_9PEZI